jgi:hypothetical protein
MSNTKNDQLEFQLSQQVLEIEKKIQLLSTQPIIKSLPILDYNGVPVIHRRTINVIQGKAGSHKSRFAESLCITLLTCDEDSQAYIGFQNSNNLNYTVCYVDTERSVEEEFTSTIKSINQNSGFYRPGGTPNFRYTSLKGIPREQRLTALKKFLQDVDQASDSPLFVVLDVATDCTSDFNSIQQTYMLLDFLGNLCESNNATFLLVIHENPSSDKARGHTGTEALNKASTVFSIGLSNDVVRLKFVKTRHTKLPPDVYLTINEETSLLQLADSESLKRVNSGSNKKADILQISASLTNHLLEPMTQQDLVAHLEEEFGVSRNTILKRLKDIEEQKITLSDGDGVKHWLTSTVINGKPTVYQLAELKEEVS